MYYSIIIQCLYEASYYVDQHNITPIKQDKGEGSAMCF